MTFNFKKMDNNDIFIDISVCISNIFRWVQYFEFFVGLLFVASGLAQSAGQKKDGPGRLSDVIYASKGKYRVLHRIGKANG